MKIPKKGTVMCMTAAVLFGLVPPLMNYLLMHGVSRPATIVGPNSLMLAATFILARRRGWPLLEEHSAALLLFLIGCVGKGATQLLLTGAYAYAAVGVATVVHFLYPTVVAGVEIMFLGKASRPVVFIAAVLSFAGMACISLFGSPSDCSPVGVLLALASAFTYSFYIVGSERFRPQTMPVAVALFWMSAGAVVTAAFYAAAEPFAFPATPGVWAAYGVCCTALAAGFGLLTAGIGSVGAVDAAFATLLEPLTAVLSSVIFAGETVTPVAAAGIAMVLASVYLNAR